VLLTHASTPQSCATKFVLRPAHYETQIAATKPIWIRGQFKSVHAQQTTGPERAIRPEIVSERVASPWNDMPPARHQCAAERFPKRCKAHLWLLHTHTAAPCVSVSQASALTPSPYPFSAQIISLGNLH
jgi:hypothetical protein